jgi:hypothetical protein
MKTMLHLPYSPDFAPLDFYLFGYVKRCLERLSFENGDELLHAVQPVLAGIEKVTLQGVFLEWMNRVRKCISPNGDCIE